MAETVGFRAVPFGRGGDGRVYTSHCIPARPPLSQGGDVIFDSSTSARLTSLCDAWL